jgi:hypothetical protein
VCQRELRHRVHVTREDLAVLVPGSMGAGSAQHGQVGADAVHPGGMAELGGVRHAGAVERQGPSALAGLVTALDEHALLAGEGGRKGVGVALEGEPPQHDLGARRGCDHAVRLHRQAKAIEQLRAQLAFLGIHGADQHEARRVHVGNTVPLDHVLAGGRGVEQQVHERVGQQVHLVHVEDAVVGPSEQARRELHLPLPQRFAQIERAGDALLRRAERQLDETARQELGERARQRRLGDAAWTAHEHAADGRVDRAQQQRELQALLSEHRAPGEHGHQPTPSSRSSRSSSSASRWAPGSRHSPRCIASSKRSVISRRALGLCSARKRRLSASST